jgi:UDP-N-acetylglucosamine 1-carboxyvinyltransferase
MHSLRINGGRPLRGKIVASGNKNAALPVLAATLLTDEAVELDNIPNIRDVQVMTSILGELGARVERSGAGRLLVTASDIKSAPPDVQLCREIRASFLLAGPLLARFGEAVLPAPGGDRIGRRPLDAHIRGFEALGATIEATSDTYRFTAPTGLHGADVFLHEMSVMATENVIMAACLARGETIIRNAASEPHVQDLCHLLRSMGAEIEGIGTNTVRIAGRDRLHGGKVSIGADNIEVGSLIALAAVTRGEILIERASPEQHRMTAIAYGLLGVHWEARGGDIFVPADQELVIQDGLHGQISKIQDAPWPGFPADLTSIALVLATQARGTVLIHEWMYESRLFWVDRLLSMGARVVVCDPHRALVHGPSRLSGQRLSGPDIRAGMALLIAALAAEGTSVIHNAHQIDRGYQDIDGRLRSLGADVERGESRRQP